MSFRDLRNFTEMMRVLGYPRLISLSNFRVPNFPLVAEILIWLVQRFEPDADIPADHENEQDRVRLIRRVAEFMAIKTNVRLNTRKLYQADGYAVQEMLKITNLLYEAQTTSIEENSLGRDSRQHKNFDISDKINDLKITRQMASQLTVIGAELFDLLGREVELREIRNSKVARQYDTAEIEVALKEVIEATRREVEDTKKQIDNVKLTVIGAELFDLLGREVELREIRNSKVARQYDTAEIEVALKEVIEATRREVEDTKKQIDNVKDNEQSLEVRIERRKTELDRNQKRLQTLKKVRPAFMEEFEKLEIELRLVYDDYLQKCRYLAYLEHLYEDAAKAEQERFERRQAATRKQLEQLRAEDASFESIMEGNDSIFATNLQDPLALGEVEKRASEKTGIQTSRQKPETAGRSSRAQITNQRRIYGSMSGRQRGVIRESNDSVGSLDSDSDLLIDGDLDDDDDDDEEDDDGMEDNLMHPVVSHEIAAFDIKPNPEKRSVSKIEHSDEDF